ncbi:hypothetical protein BD311DRAFT_772259 [Dichomitus squalens]|uniref:Uncharacterized protein n=1 Tax=Dichomitus squalens TaxID=114155 RepID=A0A4Q9M4Z8_9APHY|nr:hypothetical protein BD311DRAFT_772259 [Dichomitus squalens]
MRSPVTLSCRCSSIGVAYMHNPKQLFHLPTPAQSNSSQILSDARMYLAVVITLAPTESSSCRGPRDIGHQGLIKQGVSLKHTHSSTINCHNDALDGLWCIGAHIPLVLSPSGWQNVVACLIKIDFRRRHFHRGKGLDVHVTLFRFKYVFLHHGNLDADALYSG